MAQGGKLKKPKKSGRGKVVAKTKVTTRAVIKKQKRWAQKGATTAAPKKANAIRKAAVERRFHSEVRAQVESDLAHRLSAGGGVLIPAWRRAAVRLVVSLCLTLACRPSRLWTPHHSCRRRSRRSDESFLSIKISPGEAST